MIRLMAGAPIAFVAYSSRDIVLAQLIADAVYVANGKSDRLRYETWVNNDVPGNPLISPVLDRIEDSAFVIADITTLNLNVVYEIGFAIGSGKRAYLIRHQGTEGDKAVAREAGIFDTLGYHEYTDQDDLVTRLTSNIDPEPLQFPVELDRRVPVYLVEPPVKGLAVTAMIARLKKARYRYRSFIPGEDVRLSAVDAIRQVASSSGILVTLEEAAKPQSVVHNIRSMFVAGLANGMGKPLLFFCPAGTDVPLDVRDDVKYYRDEGDIADHIADLALEVTDHLQQDAPPAIETGALLQSLRIGDPTAENEMATLSEYYLQTDEYQRALRGGVNLVVGRKGVGKTALFIQLRDKIRRDKRNVVVDLRPEGYQLIKLKEDILSYLSQGSRQHLITAFWEYLILLEVAYKVLEKDQYTYKHNHEIRELYLELQATYKVEDFSVGGDFSERLMLLSLRIGDEYKTNYGTGSEQKLTTEQVTELLYRHDLAKLRDLISEYLERKARVWILFDNLDKGWSTQGVDEIDATVLRCLIDAGRKIEREMRKADRSLHCIVFVRNDVYEHIMRRSADYGKEMRAALDWTEPDLLREMLRLRLISGLDNKAKNLDFDQTWPTFCVSHYHGEDTSGYLIERSLMRPRNLLKIFNHCRGFATNFRHQKIDQEDIEKGLRAYSNDLLVELDHELTDVFPLARDLLYHFLDANAVMSDAELRALIKSAGVEEPNVRRIIEFLIYYGVFGLRTEEGDLYIHQVSYNPKMIEARAQRAGTKALYVIDPAFWPALNIKRSRS
jgi:hypothetical protein